MKTPLIAILLSALTINAADVSLEWNSVPEAVGYAVYYGNTTTFTPLQPALRFVTDKTNVTLSLPEGGRWYFQVAGLNTEGVDGERSDIVTTTILTAPSSVRVTQINNTMTNIYYLRK